MATLSLPGTSQPVQARRSDNDRRYPATTYRKITPVSFAHRFRRCRKRFVRRGEPPPGWFLIWRRPSSSVWFSDSAGHLTGRRPPQLPSLRRPHPPRALWRFLHISPANMGDGPPHAASVDCSWKRPTIAKPKWVVPRGPRQVSRAGCDLPSENSTSLTWSSLVI